MKEFRVGALPRGGRRRIQVTVSAPSGGMTNRYVLAVVDPGKAIDESNEQNNVAPFGPVHDPP